VAVAALGPLPLLPGAAIAQGSVTVRAQPFGGRASPVQLTGATGQPLSRAECLMDVAVPLELTNVPFRTGTTQVLSVWRGASSAMCQTATQRRPTGTGAPPCVEVHNEPATGMTMTTMLSAQTLFGSAACTAGTNTEQTFWFLIMASAGDTTTDVAATHYGTIAITLDPVPPGAPRIHGNAAGDTRIEIAWSNPSGTEELYGANVYVDAMGCDTSGRPVSTTLVAGQSPPSGIAPRQTVMGQTVTAAALSGAELGLDYGGYAAVAVTLVDRARNESPLSNVVCVQRVRISGFWDAYCAERGIPVSECRDRVAGCAIAPSGRRPLTGGTMLELVVGAVAFSALIGRRARRSP
jgi:hypothetical protein